MTDSMLSEEAVERAVRRLQTVMTLVRLTFDAGARAARELIAGGVIVDPIASCCFGEAREKLLRPDPDLPMAFVALHFAACQEPACYGPTHSAISDLLFRTLGEAVDAELAAILDEEAEATAKRHD
jgi:hypothetical protein